MLYLRLGITMVISFITARVTLQQLGVDDYGLNNLVGSVVSLFSFINGSMGTAVQRFYNIEIGRGDEQRLRRVFGVGLYLHLCVAAVTVLLAEIFAVFFLSKLNIPEERLFAAHVIFQISVLSLALNIANVPYAALLRSREMFSQTAVVDIIQAILRLGILYLLVTLDYDKLITLSILNFIVTVLYVGTLFFMGRKFQETHQLPCRDKELMRQMLGFISMLLITVLAELLNTKGIVILINIYFGLAINAAFAVAVQVLHLVKSFVINFKQSIVPQMVSAYGAGDKNSMFRLINVGTKVTFILMLMVSLPIIFEAQWILTLWLGIPPDYSAELVVLVLININVSSFTYFLYQGVHATGRITSQQMWMSCAYLMNIFLVFLAFEIGLNFLYALYITIVLSFFRAGVNVYFAKKTFNYNIRTFFYDIVSRCLITIILCVIVCVAWRNFVQPTLLANILFLFLLIGVPAFWGFAILLNKEEKVYAIELRKKLFIKLIKSR